MRRAALAAAALGIAGCGAMVDGAYLLADNTFTESARESAPTARRVERREYQVSVQPDQQLRLECYARTRQVEHSWQVTKSFEYRGGYGKGTYETTALLDGVFGGVAAAAAFAACQQDDLEVSCLHMLWASPWALDLAYSLIRSQTAREPVLVGKTHSGDQLEYADPPIKEQVADCQEVSSLWVGGVSGSSEHADLNGLGTPHALELDADSMQVPLDVDGLITLSSDAASYWASHTFTRLSVRDVDGVLHPVRVDRCEALRPLTSRFDPQALAAFRNDCPVPQLQR